MKLGKTQQVDNTAPALPDNDLKDVARSAGKEHIAARWRVNRAAIDDAVVERCALGDDDDSTLGGQFEIE